MVVPFLKKRNAESRRHSGSQMAVAQAQWAALHSLELATGTDAPHADVVTSDEADVRLLFGQCRSAAKDCGESSEEEVFFMISMGDCCSLTLIHSTTLW